MRLIDELTDYAIERYNSLLKLGSSKPIELIARLAVVWKDSRFGDSMLKWFQPIRDCAEITIHKLSATRATEADLREANAFLGLELPQDFQEFLRVENAVSFASSSHDVILPASDPEEDDHVITFICGLGEPSTFDIRHIQSYYHFDKWIGPPHVLIGGSASLQMCLHCPSGRVYGHYLETDSPSTIHAGVSRLMLLATSFEEFCRRLEPEIRA